LCVLIVDESLCDCIIFVERRELSRRFVCLTLVRHHVGDGDYLTVRSVLLLSVAAVLVSFFYLLLLLSFYEDVALVTPWGGVPPGPHRGLELSVCCWLSLFIPVIRHR